MDNDVLSASLGISLRRTTKLSYFNGLALFSQLPRLRPKGKITAKPLEKWAFMRAGLWPLLVVMLGLTSMASAQILKEKILIGRVEWVELPDLKMKFRSRIDTGAKTSSIHAEGVEEVRRDGDLWVKFRLKDDSGKEVELTRKVESIQKISNAGGFTGKRYVIREKVKLGSVVREIVVNLNDRDKMAYKFLVGRNFLLGHFAVDVARSHVTGD